MPVNVINFNLLLVRCNPKQSTNLIISKRLGLSLDQALVSIVLGRPVRNQSLHRFVKHIILEYCGTTTYHEVAEQDSNCDLAN